MKDLLAVIGALDRLGGQAGRIAAGIETTQGDLSAALESLSGISQPSARAAAQAVGQAQALARQATSTHLADFRRRAAGLARRIAA